MKRILLVDDDLTHQKFLKRFLSKFYEVDLCSSVDEFYKSTKEKVYDLVLMDIILKDKKTGIELTEDLRKRKEYKDVPIVGFTSAIDKEELLQCYKVGITDHIIKPIDYNLLVEKMESLIKHKPKK